MASAVPSPNPSTANPSPPEASKPPVPPARVTLQLSMLNGAGTLMSSTVNVRETVSSSPVSSKST